MDDKGFLINKQREGQQSKLERLKIGGLILLLGILTVVPYQSLAYAWSINQDMLADVSRGLLTWQLMLEAVYRISGVIFLGLLAGLVLFSMNRTNPDRRRFWKRIVIACSALLIICAGFIIQDIADSVGRSFISYTARDRNQTHYRSQQSNADLDLTNEQFAERLVSSEIFPIVANFNWHAGDPIDFYLYNTEGCQFYSGNLSSDCLVHTAVDSAGQKLRAVIVACNYPYTQALSQDLSGELWQKPGQSRDPAQLFVEIPRIIDPDTDEKLLIEAYQEFASEMNEAVNKPGQSDCYHSAYIGKLSLRYRGSWMTQNGISYKEVELAILRIPEH